MKRVMLALVLNAGVMGGCAPSPYYHRGPDVNPLALLNLDAGMEEAVCEYGLKTNTFRDRNDCTGFWQERYYLLWRSMKSRRAGTAYRLSQDKVDFGVLEDGVSLAMYVGDNPDRSVSGAVVIMVGNRISYENKHIKDNLKQIESSSQKISCEKKLINCP